MILLLITDLTISFQFIPQPFKITVPSPHSRVLYLKDGQICLRGEERSKDRKDLKGHLKLRG